MGDVSRKPDQMAMTLADLLSQPERLLDMGCASQPFCRKTFHMGTIGANYIDSYRICCKLNELRIEFKICVPDCQRDGL